MMQKIFSYKYLFLGLLISVLIPLSLVHADPGDTSITIPADYTGGQVTVTVRTTDGQTATLTANLTAPSTCTASVFSASPNPILSSGSTGITTITSRATCAHDIRVGSPSGSIFSPNLPANTNNSSVTGNWVTNNMVFYLQKLNDPTAGGTIGTLTVNVTTIPPTPTNLTATAGTCGSGIIYLTWSPATGATSYTLKRNGSTIYTGSNISYNDSGLSAGTTYSYTLTATNAAGTSAQASTSGTAPSACAISAPDVTFSANPTFMTSPTNSTLLTWSATNNPTSCTASTNPFNSNWNGSKTIPSGSQTISGLAIGTHTFSIYCTNANGNSAIKNTAVTVNPVASMSGNLTITNCTIASGASSCNAGLVWSTTNPVATSAITTPTNVTVATSNSGSTSYPVTGGSPSGNRNFYLYNNGVLLDQKTATASCVAGTSWNGTNCAPISGCVAAGSGTGLTGKYYNDTTLTNLITTRTDSTINFNPADSIGTSYANGGDTFSVRWEGQIQPRCSENYTFYVNSDDGTRLWINGNQVINRWVDQAPFESVTAPIALTAGTKYNIKLEFYENIGGSAVQFSWASPSTPKAIVPATQLYLACVPPTLKTATSGFSLTSSASHPTPGITQNITVNPGQLFYSYVDYGSKSVDGTIRGPYPYLANPAQNAFDRFLGWTNDPGTAARYDYINISSAPTTPGVYTYYTDIFNSSCPPVGPSAIGTVTVTGTTASVTINANSTTIPYNTATNITWSSTGATSCSVSPTGWTGLSGNQSTGNLTSSKIYTISCNPVGPNSSANVTVNVLAESKDLTIIKSGQGTVTSSPAGINCGADCTESFPVGTTVVLTATPSTGRIFTGWGPGCDSSTKNPDGSGGTCTINISTNKSIITNFAVDPNYKEF